MSASIYLISQLRKLRREFEAKHQRAMLEMRRNRPGTAAYKNAKRLAEYYHKRLYPKKAYFYDGYDGTSLMKRLGLTWQDERILRHIGPDGWMNVSAAAALLKGLKKKRLKPVTRQEVRALRLPLGEMSVADWQKFFTRKKGELLRLLRTSVEMNEPLKFSV